MTLSVNPKNEAFFLTQLQPLWDSCRPAGDPGPTFMKIEQSDSPGFFFANLLPHQLDNVQFLAARLIEGIPNSELHAVAGFLTSAIISCKRDGEFLVPRVLHHLGNSLQAYASLPREIYDCFFITDLPSAYLDQVQRPVCGARLRACQWAEALVRLGGTPQEVWQEHRSRVELAEVFAYRVAHVAVDARHEQEALERAWLAFSFRRSIANFVSAQLHNRWTIGGATLESPARFKESPLMAVRRDGCEPLNRELLVQISREPADELNWQGLEVTQKIIDAFPNAETSAGHSLTRLYRAFQIFGLALDEGSPADQFLGLWQSIEILSNPVSKSGRSGDTSEICRRIANMFTTPEEILPYLDAMAPIRNRLVHDGEFVDEYAAASYWMRQIACDTLKRFAVLARDLPTDEHFTEFFSLRTCGNKLLQMELHDSEARSLAKKFILELRGGRKPGHPLQPTILKPPGL